MAYSVAYQHTDSNRNHDGSDIVHGTLKMGIGFGESSSNPIYYNGEINKKKEARGDFQKSFLLKRNNGVYVLDEILNGFE